MRARPARRTSWAAASGALALLWARAAPAHERWVKHDAKPFDHSYFHSMSGEVLELSLLASAAVAVIVGLWYLGALELVERLTPTSIEKNTARAKRGPVGRFFVGIARFALDGYIDNRWWARAEAISVFVFARLPGLVLLLGAYEGWLVMPSFPITGPLGDKIATVEVVLAVWILWGRFQVALGAALIAVFVYIAVVYRLAVIDGIPVVASALFYLNARRGTLLSPRQISGIRFGLGVGFILLGLVNKIYDAELFIGVGDNYPQLVAGPRSMFPWLTRESWSFVTALGEMVFGLLLLVGTFSRLTALVLTFIFANFIFVFGWPEIVHLYPISGFMVLMMYASPSTALDGFVFRTHVRAWQAMGYRTSFLIYRASVFVVAIAVASLMIFAPLYVTVALLPRLGL